MPGDVESIFSQLGHIISKDRTRLDESTIMGLMVCKSTMEASEKPCYEYHINDDMIVHTLYSRSQYMTRFTEKRKSEVHEDEVLEREKVSKDQGI